MKDITGGRKDEGGERKKKERGRDFALETEREEQVNVAKTEGEQKEE